MEENLAYKYFIRFLKEEGVYIQFKRNFKEQTSIRLAWANGSKSSFSSCDKVISMKDFTFNIKNKANILGWAFSWANTIQGQHFWETLSDKWANEWTRIIW